VVIQFFYHTERKATVAVHLKVFDKWATWPFIFNFVCRNGLHHGF